jgi:ABC-type nitrate/sulfonate/bicarbonate transport system substrate-binding protein
MARVLAAHAKATAWFEDDRNRAEAVRIMVEASKLKPDEVEKSYDFFRKGKFFEPTGKVSRQKLGALIDALVSLGDAQKIEVEKLVLPGVTQISE